MSRPPSSMTLSWGMGWRFMLYYERDGFRSVLPPVLKRMLFVSGDAGVDLSVSYEGHRYRVEAEDIPRM